MDGDEELLGQPRHPSRRRRAAYLLGAAVLVTAVLTGVLSRHQSGRPAAGPQPTPGNSRPTQPLASGTPSTLPQGHGWRPWIAEYRIFARAADSVVQIDYSTLRVTATPIPALPVGTVTFLATADGVLVRPSTGAGYYVPDNKPAERAVGVMAADTLPGPTPGQFWQPVYAHGQLTDLRLLSADGSIRTTMRLPHGLGQFFGPLASDGSGYVLATTSRGWYDLRPHGSRLVPNRAPALAQVLAAGSNRLIVCTPPHVPERRCRASVVRLASGRLPTPLGTLTLPASQLTGPVAPDARTALVYQPSGPGQLVAQLLDLDTGRFLGDPVAVDPDTESGAAVYTPDGHWVFLVGRGGRLLALDARTGRLQGLGLRLPYLYQLLARSPHSP